MPGEPPVTATEHVADPPLPLSVQLELAGDAPAPLAVKLTLPVGVDAVPADVSLTVATHVLEPPVPIGLLQLTLVDVVRTLTVMDALLELVPCAESPA